MVTLLLLGLVGYGVVQLVMMAAKNPQATVGAGKLVVGLLKK